MVSSGFFSTWTGLSWFIPFYVVPSSKLSPFKLNWEKPSIDFGGYVWLSRSVVDSKLFNGQKSKGKGGP